MKVTDLVVCPFCGEKFDWSFNVQTRAPVGSGTRRPIKRLTRNHIQICDTILHHGGQFKTAKEIRSLMHRRGLNYKTRIGERYWDTHDTQAQLSLLVYNGFVSMTQPSIEYFDFVESRFKVSPTPRYYMDKTNALKYARWMKRQHRIMVVLPHPLEDFIPVEEEV